MKVLRTPDDLTPDLEGFRMPQRRAKILSKFAALTALCLTCGCATGPYSQGSDAAVADPISTTNEEDADAGVYFPPPSSTESHRTQFRVSVDPGPVRRQFFADQINLIASAPSRELPVIAQAVGVERRVLVLTMIDAGPTPTPYLARAVLARATSVIRFAPVLAELGISQDLDFYNVAAVIGFDRIVVTDARVFAHQVHLASD